MPDPVKKQKQNKLQFITPVLFVLMIAALLVFIKVLPELPAIVDTTEEFREDQEALVEAPPLPESDTSTVGLTNPNIFEPPPSGDTDEENLTPEDLEPSTRSKTIAGIVDALIYILIAVFGGFGIYLLFKMRKRMTIKAMFGSLLMIVACATCIFFGFMVYRMVDFKSPLSLNDTQLFFILLLFSAPISTFISYALFSKKVSIQTRNYALLGIGALMGSFLAALLPLYGVIPLVIAISLFDIYSVRQGPIKKIMTLQDEGKSQKTSVKAVESKPSKKPQEEPIEAASSEPSIPKQPKEAVKKKKVQSVDDDSDLMLLYEAPEWSIGIGDFVIYSMFASFVLTHTMQFLPYYGFYTPVVGFIVPWLIFLLTIFGLLIGFSYTLKLLSQRSLMPGLPLAIFFGLISFLGALLIMELVNLLAYGKFAPIV